MTTQRIFQLILVLAILVASFASTGIASAWSSCASYITVQRGDTLSGIALLCGTTVGAIRAANPGLGSWIYAGQVLCIPTGYTSTPVNYNYPTYGNTYVVQWGDTLGKISARTGISVASLLAANPQIWNPSLIYAGQVINLPGSVSVPNYPPPYQLDDEDDYPFPDSLSSLKIDYKHGLYVRSNPGGPIIASALDKTTWYYRPSSVFTDSHWKVWAEVKLFPPVNGYTTGWILVKDQLGTFFTDPHIDD